MGVGVVTKNWEAVFDYNSMSLFTAEDYAIWTAVKKLSLSSTKIIIYTDSLSTLKALHLENQLELLLEDILSMAASNRYGRSIHFSWVPSNVGARGSGATDKCASTATYKA